MFDSNAQAADMLGPNVNISGVRNRANKYVRSFLCPCSSLANRYGIRGSALSSGEACNRKTSSRRLISFVVELSKYINAKRQLLKPIVQRFYTWMESINWFNIQLACFAPISRVRMGIIKLFHFFI